MSSEEEIAKLADTLKDQITSEAKDFLKEITEGDKEFFGDVAKRFAKAYYKKKMGDDTDKEEADESIEALNIAMGSKIAERGLDFIDAERGQEMLMSILKTVGKTVLTLALA